MQPFGGDPRIVSLKILIELNKWYFLIILCMFICLIPVRSQDITFMLMFFLFAFVEIVRLILSRSYDAGEIPMFTAFIVITLVPLLVIDLLWLFFVRTRTGFDYAAMSGMIIFHIVEFVVFGFPQLVRLARYQNSFFQFQYAYQNISRANNDMD
jgi:hypothetical protein